MSFRFLLIAGVAVALAACAEEGPAIETPEPGVDLPEPSAGPEALIPELEQCDAEEYRGLIGTNVAAATLPSDPMLRIYGENDIITQDYLPQRTNIVYAADGTILRVTCG